MDEKHQAEYERLTGDAGTTIGWIAAYLGKMQQAVEAGRWVEAKAWMDMIEEAIDEQRVFDDLAQLEIRDLLHP